MEALRQIGLRQDGIKNGMLRKGLMDMADFKKKLPIGIENFEKIRTEGFYYVDKTGLIRDLLLNWGEVNLFTRPRRFGKSLNMSMLKSFLEVGCDRSLFEGLEISKEAELCEEYMGKFPVVSISLKSAQADSFDTAKAMMRYMISEETNRLMRAVPQDSLNEFQRDAVSRLLDLDMSDADLMNSLRTLSAVLYQHYGKKTVILIDEYDVPLAKANERGYYDEMVTLIRNLFEQALKTNENLQFAVLTGCLRISKESIFTGLNNPRVLSIVDVQFDEYFGFTDRDVKGLLEYYGLSALYSVIKEWYDGYRFGNVDVYCPWNVICYCDKLRADKTVAPDNYWSNTSSNNVVRHFIEMADKGATQREIERLIAGEVVTKEIHQELTYRELYDSIDNIWSVLFTTGYLTQRGMAEGNLFRLVIPNMEIRKIFTGQIMKLFKENVQKDGEALKQIEATGYAEKLREEGMQTILKYGISCYKKRCRVVLKKE